MQTSVNFTTALQVSSGRSSPDSASSVLDLPKLPAEESPVEKQSMQIDQAYDPINWKAPWTAEDFVEPNLNWNPDYCNGFEDFEDFEAVGDLDPNQNKFPELTDMMALQNDFETIGECMDVDEEEEEALRECAKQFDAEQNTDAHFVDRFRAMERDFNQNGEQNNNDVTEKDCDGILSEEFDFGDVLNQDATKQDEVIDAKVVAEDKVVVPSDSDEEDEVIEQGSIALLPLSQASLNVKKNIVKKSNKNKFCPQFKKLSKKQSLFKLLTPAEDDNKQRVAQMNRAAQQFIKGSSKQSTPAHQNSIPTNRPVSDAARWLVKDFGRPQVHFQRFQGL